MPAFSSVPSEPLSNNDFELGPLVIVGCEACALCDLSELNTYYAFMTVVPSDSVVRQFKVPCGTTLLVKYHRLLIDNTNGMFVTGNPSRRARIIEAS
jgi:hypothetical protein